LLGYSSTIPYVNGNNGIVVFRQKRSYSDASYNILTTHNRDKRYTEENTTRCKTIVFNKFKSPQPENLCYITLKTHCMIVNGPYGRSGDNLSDKLFSNHIDSTLAPVTIVHGPYVVKPR